MSPRLCPALSCSAFPLPVNFLGGSEGDYGLAVAVDGSGNVCVSGYSDATWGSPVQAYTGSWDAFAAKLDSDGNLPGIAISGTTGEVNCEVLGDVTLDLFDIGETPCGSTTSDGAGAYTLTAPESGTYTITAGKTDFQDRTQQVVVGTDPVTLDFLAETGLIPKGAEMSYVLTCVNHWLYPEGECGLEMSTVLAVVNAWLYPQT